MHRATPSQHHHQHAGGLFKGSNFFGTARRPSTSRGKKDKDNKEKDDDSPPPAVPEPVHGLNRKSSFRGRFYSTSGTSPERQRPSIQHSDSGEPAEEQAKSGTAQQQQTSSTANSTRGHSRMDSYTAILPFSNIPMRPVTPHGNLGTSGMSSMSQNPLPSPTLENITYLHIQETSSKRISTLDYLRKAHEGRVYWFNTLLFNKPDLQRMPYFDSRKLARRATNYLLLGLSLPTVLDLNSSTPTEFLKTLNALLTEFESFQSIHPPDGSSSLSRARFPQMFKRATTSAGKGRRTSSAADIGLPMGNDSSDSKGMNGSGGGAVNSATAFTLGETDLFPGEEYTHLLTPALPFDPDFYETFATLCDVLIDCYTKLMSLVSGPRECSPYIAELFTKADSRVRKILVQGVVKEFEDSSRAGAKGELAGVGRVVLGGLM